METIKQEFEDEETAKPELAIASKTSEYAVMLEAKCKALEHELVSVKEELMALKRKNGELEEERIALMQKANNVYDDDDDPMLQLMIENKLLECEKKRAEEVAESLKENVRELEAQVRRLGSEKAMDLEGTPIGTPYMHAWPIKEEKIDGGLKNSSDSSRVRKKLLYKDENGTIKSMAPSTPAGLRHKVDVISISDSDDEPGETLGIKRELKLDSSLNETDEDGPSGCTGESLRRSTPSKRKRASNIVASDSDTDDEDDDDKVPIATLRRKRLQLNGYSKADDATEPVTPQRRRRLVSLSRLEEGNKEGDKSPLSCRKICETKHENEDGDAEEDESESESEGESLGGFIVDDDPSDGNDVSGNSDNTNNESDTVSDENMEFGEIMSTLKRNRDDKLEWEFEADMLAALGKDDELCLKAVCALYRRQTAEEKSVKGTIYSNGRGFNQFDALRGTTLAEFLLDGNMEIRSVRELRAFDANGIEKCRTFANRYSKQLFDIYKSNEDPSFRPS